MLSHWLNKFRNAVRGIGLAVRGQSSFAVHVPVALAVLAAGILLHVSRVEWMMLIICIGIVMSAEIFNSALEQLVRAIHPESDIRIGAALDMASAAVLVVSCMAASIGLLIFLPYF